MISSWDTQDQANILKLVCWIITLCHRRLNNLETNIKCNLLHLDQVYINAKEKSLSSWDDQDHADDAASTTTQQQLAYFPSLNAYYRSWGANQSIVKSNCY